VRPPSRRTFLRASAATGGGLLVSFSLPARIGAALVAGPPPRDFVPNGFIRIDRDSRITLVIHKVEMGQGTYTSMPMLLAEELEVDLSQVRLEHAPPDDALYAEPFFGVQETGGSTSVRGNWEPLRRAGATARSMLVSAAAETWRVPPASCRAASGAVIHGPTGRSLTYGALVDRAALLPVPRHRFHFVANWHWFEHELAPVWKPFLLGCLVCAIVAACLGWLTLEALWRWQVLARYRARLGGLKRPLG